MGEEVSETALCFGKIPSTSSARAKGLSGLIWLVGISALSLLTTPIGDQPSPFPAPAPSLIKKPEFSQLPTADDFVTSYPEAAQRSRTIGTALLICTVTETGALEPCQILEEKPADAGFGKAALEMSKKFHLKAMDAEGLPTTGRSFKTRLIWRVQ